MYTLTNGGYVCEMTADDTVMVRCKNVYHQFFQFDSTRVWCSRRCPIKRKSFYAMDNRIQMICYAFVYQIIPSKLIIANDVYACGAAIPHGGTDGLAFAAETTVSNVVPIICFLTYWNRSLLTITAFAGLYLLMHLHSLFRKISSALAHFLKLIATLEWHVIMAKYSFIVFACQTSEHPYSYMQYNY